MKFCLPYRPRKYNSLAGTETSSQLGKKLIVTIMSSKQRAKDASMQPAASDNATEIKQTEEQQNVVNAAVNLASYGVVLQVAFRLTSFVLNGLLLRFISQETLGTVNVRLMLLSSTILFFSREAFRRALSGKKATDDSQDSRRRFVNTLWLCVPVGVMNALFLSLIWTRLLERPSDAIRNYDHAVYAYALSAVLELCSEPLYIVAQLQLFTRLRIVIESISLTVRAILSCSLVYVFRSTPLLCFSAAQLTSASVLTVSYYMYMGRHFKQSSKEKTGAEWQFSSLRETLPRVEWRKPMASQLDTSSAGLIGTFFRQSFLKQLLTEGERYVMTFFSLISLSEQGVFDVVNNLASLVARTLFLPLEDACYLLFTRLLRRGEPANVQQVDGLQLAAQTVGNLLKLMVYVGLMAILFGGSYAFLALYLYGGTTLIVGDLAPPLLRSMCVYILFLALNGVSEGFMFATLSRERVDKYNYKLLLFSAVTLASSIALASRYGSIGFVCANCINMAMRIFVNFRYIAEYFRPTAEQSVGESSKKPTHPLTLVMPSNSVIGVIVAAAVYMTALNTKFCCDYTFVSGSQHIAFGLIAVLFIALAIWLRERSMLRFLKDLFIDRKFKTQ